MESKTKTNDVDVEMEAFAVVRREMLKILKDKPEGKDDRMISTVLHVSNEWIEENQGPWPKCGIVSRMPNFIPPNTNWRLVTQRTCPRSFLTCG